MSTQEIQFLDSCLSCYFQGFPGIVFAVPCHAGMKWADVKEGIESDANGSDLGIEDWDAFESAVAIAFHGLDMESRVDFLDHDLMESEEKTAEESGIELDDSVYAYFGLVDLNSEN